MDYRKEAIECVKDHVLPLHKQIYAKFDGDFDKIFNFALTHSHICVVAIFLI